MEECLASIPWSRPKYWQAANSCLEQTIARAGGRLNKCRDLALRQAAAYRSLFPALDRLCRLTCPRCRDICCRRAWVWFDFKDLLFLHLAGLPVPPGQLRSPSGGGCRYITPSGCELDRLQRPFVCTWYLCPAQTRRLGRLPGKEQAAVHQRLAKIKHLRRKMESAFIHTTT